MTRPVPIPHNSAAAGCLKRGAYVVLLWRGGSRKNGSSGLLSALFMALCMVVRIVHECGFVNRIGNGGSLTQMCICFFWVDGTHLGKIPTLFTLLRKYISSDKKKKTPFT